jgi:hypothetical protein
MRPVCRAVGVSRVALMRAFIRSAAVFASFALASCGPVNGPSIAPVSGSASSPHGCYVTTIAPANVSATITFYGWPDNDPPGKAIAHPVIHKRAGGDGTYCNPTTFATERSNNAQIPYGTKLYVPFLKHYFVREDDCAPSGPPVGSGNNGCYKLWFDLWIGGNGQSKTQAVVNCEDSMTPGGKVTVIVNPNAGEPVAHAGPIYRNAPPPNGTCYDKPGTTSPSRKASSILKSSGTSSRM